MAYHLSGVFGADIGDEFGEGGEVIGQFAAIGFGADHVAEDAAEVFMAGEGEETARVGEHADEAREQSGGAQGVELEFHAVLLIEEPPTGTELDFSGAGAVLESAGEGGEEVIVAWVDVVKNHAGKLIAGSEGVEVVDEAMALGAIAHRIETAIGTELRCHTRVDIAEGAKVELFGPAFLGIELAEKNHEVVGELFFLEHGDEFAVKGFLENAGGEGIIAGSGGAVVEPVIGHACARCVEVIVALAQGGAKIIEGGNFPLAGCGEFFDPCAVGVSLVDGEGFVGSEGG